MRAARRSAFLLLGFAGGIVGGTFLWSNVRHNYRRNLFSRRPLERFIALSYLSARRTFETARLLHDYIRWEENAMLREQGKRLLRRVESQLRESA